MILSDTRPWKRSRHRGRPLYTRAPPLASLLLLLQLLPGANSAPPPEQFFPTSVHTNPTSLPEDSTQHPAPNVLADCLSPAIDEFPDDFMTQWQRSRGGVIVHIIIVFYLCIFLGMVCDKYFVPSLDLICEILHVPTDIAGATFMAIGTSAPELFSSVIGSFITEGDIGVGAIVGSAVFNVIGITGIAGIAVWKMEVHIDWYPVSRDCLAYTLSVLVLMFVLQDSKVVWYEALVMLIMFVVYVVMMCYNARLQKFCTNHFESAKTIWKSRFDRSSDEKTPLLGSHVVIVEPQKMKKKVRFADDEEGRKCILDSNDNFAQILEQVKDSENSLWKIPAGSGCLMSMAWVLMWPASVLLHFTVPDCRQEKWKSFYLATFTMAVVWIAASTYLSVWIVTIIGHTFAIPDSISGITLLAVGTSVPEIISSVLVIRNGHGNMAICNLLGSNVFNIVFCLGAPWLIKTTLMSVDGAVHINSAALTYMILTLLSSAVVLYVAFILTKWKIGRTIGVICILMYLAFIGLACFFELGLLAGTNLPICLT